MYSRRCAKLVMNCLSAFDDASMNRMSVAICSILAAKISTIETSMLGAQPQYMSKLLSMVRSKVQSKSVDITMKFTLSALWNLTDESAATCKVFLEEGGMELFLEVLDSFQGESSVETKVLGLLNNIAEVGFFTVLRFKVLESFRRFLLKVKYCAMCSFESLKLQEFSMNPSTVFTLYDIAITFVDCNYAVHLSE